MGNLIFNDARWRQQLDFDGLVWEGNLRPTDVDIVFEFGRKNLCIMGEIKSGDARLPVGQRKLLENYSKVHEASGILTPVFLARHNTPTGKDVMVQDCIVDSYYTGGKWTIDGKRTVKQFMTKYVDAALHPEIELEPPHCADCKLKKGCISNADADEDEEQACPLFEREL